MLNEDLYKYFKIEGRELVEALTRDILELEREGPGEELLRRLLREAHTLKGAARVVQVSGIAEIAHAMEDVLEEYRGGAESVPKETISRLLKQVDKISAGLRALDPPAPAGKAVHAAAIEPFERVRVELAEMDALLSGVSETAVQLNGIRHGIEAVHSVETRLSALEAELGSEIASGTHNGHRLPETTRLHDSFEELRIALQRARRNLSARTDLGEREISEVRGNIDRLRLLPASVLFPSLERAVHDAAGTLGKQVHFETLGGDQRLESHVLTEVGAALLHLARNAIAHGIEFPTDRLAGGKPASGKVLLQVEQRADRLVFTCTDDGRGIDVEAVGKVAVSRGLIPADSTATATEAIELIFRPGVTTSESISEIAGRGIGLDVVREVASRLKGRVSVDTESGRGARIAIDLPISLSSVRAVQLLTDGLLVWIPLEAMRCAVWLEEDATISSAGRESLIFEGRAIPFLNLAMPLGSPVQGTSPPRSAAIIQFGSELLALGVDRVLRAESVLVHPLPASVGRLALVAGASFDAQGNPQLVLNPQALFETARSATTVQADPPEITPRILVIDDSLSSRVLEQSILEAAGYLVDLAVTAEDALIKARQRRYSLFVCDVEMPGMNGFEFVSLTREYSYLLGIPSILVTTRGAPEDRRRGVEVGARAYVVKGELSEESLVETVRSLVG